MITKTLDFYSNKYFRAYQNSKNSIQKKLFKNKNRILKKIKINKINTPFKNKKILMQTNQQLMIILINQNYNTKTSKIKC